MLSTMQPYQTHCPVVPLSAGLGLLLLSVLTPWPLPWGKRRAFLVSFPETIPRSRSYVVRGTKMLLLYSAVLLAVIAANVVTVVLAATIAYRRMHHD